MKERCLHHVRFTPELWRKWLKRFNAKPNLRLREGIHEMRSRLAAYELKNR